MFFVKIKATNVTFIYKISKQNKHSSVFVKAADRSLQTLDHLCSVKLTI